MKKVGIIGGGQLGKMMILDGKRLDTRFVILDPTEHCPAHGIADRHIVAGFDDEEAMLRLARQVDVVTYEFEHISVKALQAIEALGIPVYPSSDTLSHIQNKLEQKEWLKAHGIAVPSFLKVEDLTQLRHVCETLGYPVMLKTCTGGYDGKGNGKISTPEEVEAVFESLGAGCVPLMAEACVDFEKEISVLVCRGLKGEVTLFPVAENVHKNSILDETTVPAAIGESTNREALDVARACVEAVNAYGMLCIELFVTKEGHVLVNELAPRPHNSGHYTIEGCCTSQFEQHIRAILGFPMGDTALLAPTAMKNIIGDHDGAGILSGLEEAYGYPRAKIHIYGKDKLTRGRKMGHVTATASTIQEALDQVRGACEALHYE